MDIGELISDLANKYPLAAIAIAVVLAKALPVGVAFIEGIMSSFQEWLESAPAPRGKRH